MGALTSHGVLILINVRWWNATAFYAVNIGRILQKNGHRVIIGCNEKYPAYRMAESYGLHTVHLNFSGNNIPDLFRSFLRLVKLIRKENIRIVNSHRSIDHTYAFLAKLITRVKMVITRGDRRRVKRNLLSPLRYRFCDALVLTCRSIFNQNKDIFSPISHKVSIIYGSVDEDHFKILAGRRRTAEKYGIDTGKCVIGLVGRLSRVKDPYTFIKAAFSVLQQYKEVVFVIAGKPIEIGHQDLDAELKRFDIRDAFVLLPEIDDIAEVIDLFDIGVILSVDSETISRVLFEYMYLKKPVIGTRVNAIEEILEPGVNGELIGLWDEEGLAAAMQRLIENPGLRSAYGSNSYRLYKEKYSEAVFYDRYRRVLRDVMSDESW